MLKVRCVRAYHKNPFHINRKIKGQFIKTFSSIDELVKYAFNTAGKIYFVCVWTDIGDKNYKIFVQKYRALMMKRSNNHKL